MTTAICLFALCFSPTIFGVFLAGMGDAILAMAISIVMGSAVGGFLCLLILEPETGASSKNFSLLGIGLGVGFGLLRIAQADGLEGYLTAIALTVLECITVVGLDWFAAKRRNVAEAYRMSRTQIVALEQAISSIDGQIAKEENTYAVVLQRIEDRENEDFDPQQLAEEADWAVEAEYRASINSNEQRRLGGAPTALPTKTLAAFGD